MSKLGKLGRFLKNVGHFAPLLFTLLLSAGCASHRPPALGPVAAVAWTQTQVTLGLDQVRDVAIAAGTVGTPPLLAEASVRAVVQMHQSALLLIHEAPTGWRTLTRTIIEQGMLALPDREQAVIAPYVTVVWTLLEVR